MREALVITEAEALTILQLFDEGKGDAGFILQEFRAGRLAAHPDACRELFSLLRGQSYPSLIDPRTGVTYAYRTMHERRRAAIEARDAAALPAFYSKQKDQQLVGFKELVKKLRSEVEALRTEVEILRLRIRPWPDAN